MTDILLPVGRMVGGSFYEARLLTDDDGQPVIDQKTGKQKSSFSFALAIKKTCADWKQESWGAIAYSVGASGYPAFIANPAFAWKIVDGDSNVPNENNKIPCENPNYVGNWIIWFSQSFPIRVVNQKGTKDLVRPSDVRSDQNPSGLIVNELGQEIGEILPGYFIEVMASVVPNKPPANGKKGKPGIYWNPVAVALSAFGPRIESTKIDTSKVGFGSAALPAGASAAPVGNLQALASSAPAAIPAAAPAPAATPAAPAPNPAILNVPPRKTMTAKAGGATYEAFVANGWKDEDMVAQGYLVIG